MFQIPLRARVGGVRERGGHTEAAIDLCRLAGKAELVPEGTEVEGVAERYEEGMMRRKGCLEFGKKWGLKVISIEDLVRHFGVLSSLATLQGSVCWMEVAKIENIFTEFDV